VQSLIYRVKSSSLSKASLDRFLSRTNLADAAIAIQSKLDIWKSDPVYKTTQDFDDPSIRCRSGCIEGKLQLLPGAIQKARTLRNNVSRQFDWAELPSDKTFHQRELQLYIYDIKEVKLIAYEDTHQYPICLSGGVNGFDVPCRDDFIASLMMTCCLDIEMVKHISKSCQGYYIRWRLSKYGRAEDNNSKIPDITR
jgi:hypothetical protein